MKKFVFPIFLVFLLLLCGLTVSAEDVPQGQAGGQDVTAAIGAPSGLSLTIDAKGFHLKWRPSPEDSGKVTGYEIVRSSRFSGPFMLLDSVSQGVHQYIDYSTDSGVVYFYKVRAVAGSQYSYFSNTAGGERPSGAP